MKKVLFMLAAAAFVLVGCEKDPEVVSNITSISIEESVTLLAGTDEVVPLTLTWEPETETLDYTQVSWTSSDEAVVTVDADGGLLAIAGGVATVTAKYNDLVAVCEVTVIEDPRELITWGDFYLINEGQAISEDTVQIVDGEEVFNCLLHLAIFYFTDANIVTDELGQFVGTGYVAISYAPVYVIYGGDYDGYYFSPRKGYRFATSIQDALASYTTTNADDFQYAVLPQGISDANAYATFIGGLLSGTLSYGSPEHEAYEQAMPWGGLQEVDFSDGSAWPIEGFLGEGTFVDGANYDFSVNWLQGAYGLNYNITEAGELEIIEPYELLPLFSIRYTQSAPVDAPAAVASAPAYKMNINKIQYNKAIVNVK